MNSELDEYIRAHRKDETKKSDFTEYLYVLMDRHGYPDSPEFYRKANITRQSWSTLISGKNRPSLNTCLKIVFTLHATNRECKYLLKKAGYTLASDSVYSLILRYCLEKGIYDLVEVNDLLIAYGYGDSLIA